MSPPVGSGFPTTAKNDELPINLLYRAVGLEQKLLPLYAEIIILHVFALLLGLFFIYVHKVLIPKYLPPTEFGNESESEGRGTHKYKGHHRSSNKKDSKTSNSKRSKSPKSSN